MQIAYAIGVSEPVSVAAVGYDADGRKTDVGDEVRRDYDLTPRGIIESMGLLELDYGKIASGNHMLSFI